MRSAKPILEIDLERVIYNYRLLVGLAPGASIAAVLKANAYGLGFAPISEAIKESAGGKDFVVATLDEAVSLREHLGRNVNIFVLNGIFTNDIEYFIHYNLIPVLNNIQQILMWQNCAEKYNKLLPCVLHIDTGLHRMGISEDEQEYLLNNIRSFTGLDIYYIISHLAASEDANNPYNQEQLLYATFS
jgi:alanine racemase